MTENEHYTNCERECHHRSVKEKGDSKEDSLVRRIALQGMPME